MRQSPTTIRSQIGVALWALSKLQEAFVAGPLRMGVMVGLFAFLLHDMINFAMFVPATATSFFALLAVCVSAGSIDRSEANAVSVVNR